MLLRILDGLLARGRKPERIDLASAFRLCQEGELDAAEEACRGLLEAPLAEVAYLRGLIAYKRGDIAAAIGLFRVAVAERETEGSYHLSLGNALAALRQFDAASGHYARFLELSAAEDPRHLAASVGYAECRAAIQDHEGAREWYRRAVALAKDDPATLSKAIQFLYQESRIDEARALADRRQRVRPESAANAIERALLLPAIYGSRDEIACTRSRLAADLDELLERPLARVAVPEREINLTPFYLAYHAENSIDLLKKVAAVCRKVYAADAGLRPAKDAGKRPIRVGFVSTCFHLHSVGRTTFGLIRDLPRDRFAVTVFSIAPRDDALHRAIAAAADTHVTLPHSVEDARRAIGQAGLDVLVFADLGMHPTTYFLAFWRLAPVQVVTWGHSETSGIDTVDYYFSADGVETDAAPSHYSETLVRPKAFFMPAYERPRLDPALGREALGLPQDRTLYACLQQAFKFHPDFDEVLAGILDRDPTGEILLIGSRSSWTEQLRARWSPRLGAQLERMRFLPNMEQQRFFATLAAADVCLDPLHFGGCNSSIEAMAFGVPIVTLPGTHLHGRFTLGLYAEMGFLDCVVATPDRYIDLAVALGRDRDFRASVSREIIRRSEPLFDRKDIALALGDFLEQAVRSRN